MLLKKLIGCKAPNRVFLLPRPIIHPEEHQLTMPSHKLGEVDYTVNVFTLTEGLVAKDKCYMICI